MRLTIRSFGLFLLAVFALGLPIPPGAAQDVSPETGICDGAICGPSGAFTVASFPTRTDITWDAFPANPPRPTTPTIRVAPGDSINAAVNNARPGDVIAVADGVYAIGEPDTFEGLVLDTPGITLMAEHVGGVTLVPRAGENPPVLGIQARADDLVIDGFVIQGFSGVGIEFGREDSPQSGLVLKHLRVEQTEEGIRSAYVGDGVTPVIDGLLVYDVWLREIGVIGLQCGAGPCANMRFEALRIALSGTPDSDTAADALAVESGENVVVFNAEISGAPGDGIDLKSARNAVANVSVHDLGRNGIKLWQSGDVINALVYNTGADAALVFEAGTYRVLNSLIARHAWGDSAYAMTVAYDTPTEPGSLEIINSVFYQNAGAVWVSPATALTVQNSLFFGSGNGEELIWEPVVVGENAAPVSTLGAAGIGNLDFVDPLFDDPDMGDYAWGVGSPLADAGAQIDGLPAFDLTSGPRVSGSGVDLGPWERE